MLQAKIATKPAIFPALVGEEIPLPEFLLGAVAKFCPFHTADLRKMWPHLCRLVGASGKWPLGDKDVQLFVYEQMKKPGIGSCVLAAAIDAGVDKQFPLLVDQDDCIRVAADESADARPNMLAVSHFLAPWAGERLPVRAEVEKFLADNPEYEQPEIGQALKYCDAIAAKFAPTEDEVGAESSAATDGGPNSLTSLERFEHLRSRVEKSIGLAKPRELLRDYELILRDLEELKSCAEVCTAGETNALVEEINLAISQIRSTILVVNEVAKMQFLAALEGDELVANDVRANERLANSAKEAVRFHPVLTAAAGVMQSAERASSEAALDADDQVLAAAGMAARQAFRSALTHYKDLVAVIRPLLAKEIAGPAPAHILESASSADSRSSAGSVGEADSLAKVTEPSAGLAKEPAVSPGDSGASPGTTPERASPSTQARLVVGPASPRALSSTSIWPQRLSEFVRAAGGVPSEVQPAAAVLMEHGLSLPALNFRHSLPPAAVASLPLARALEAAAVAALPIEATIEPRDAMVAAQLSSEPQGGVTSPAVEASLRAIASLLERRLPGIAHLIARLHEDAYLEELPGGASFYVLIACAVCLSDTTPAWSETTTDRHFTALIQAIDRGADEAFAPQTQALAIGFLAAAIYPALFVRHASVVYSFPSIKGRLGSPALEHFVELLGEPVNTALASTPATLRTALGHAETTRHARLTALGQRARQIIENLDSQTRHDFSNHAQCQKTWQHLRSTNDPMGVALHALARGVEHSVLEQQIEGAIGYLAAGVDTVIDDAFAKFSTDKLIYTNRARLIDAVEHIEVFLEEAQAILNPPAVDERLTSYAHRLAEGLRSAREELLSKKSDGIAGLARIAAIAAIESVQKSMASESPIGSQLSIDARFSRDLVSVDVDLGVEINGALMDGKSAYALGREFIVHGDAREVLDALVERSSSLQPTNDLAGDVRRHLRAQRLLSALNALTHLRREDPDHDGIAELTDEFEAVRASFRIALEERIQGVRKALARAGFSSLLPTSEIASLEASLDRVGILSRTFPLQGPVPGPLRNDQPADFRSAEQYIELAISEPVERRQRDALAEFESKVATERSAIPPRLIPAVSRVLDLARAGQLVTADEFFSQLRAGEDLPVQETGNPRLREFHEFFLPAVLKEKRLGSIREDFVGFMKGSDESFYGIPFDRNETATAGLLLEHWVEATRPPSRNNIGRYVTQFFTTLTKSQASCGTPPHLHGNVTLLEIAAIDFKKAVGIEAFVVPLLGSQSKGMFRVAVADSPSLTVVREALGHSPEILLTRARFSTEDRKKLYAEIRRAQRGCLIIDEALLIYAALNPGGATARVLSVASSFLCTEPYKVQDATTPEMFFGRRTPRRRVFESRAALIYGGRRLGKSSIIADICSRETSAAQKKFYVHVELSNSMEFKQYETMVWQRIGQELLDAKVVTTAPIAYNNGQPTAVVGAIREALREGKAQKLTIYLDEADTFMKHEEASQFKVLYELSQLATRFDGFAWAISGLNNVQKVSSLGWNPRLGRVEVIPVTPFVGEERADGLRLICEPLAALGFEFEGDDLPLQILAAASFYPALIQAYCRTLLSAMYKKPANGVAPFIITQRDLQDAENDERLKETLLVIFERTVTLDPRYMAVCAVLAETMNTCDQVADSAMLLSAIADRAAEIAPNLFKRGNHTVIVEAAADSLINMGILVRIPNTQRYQFRSPRIQSRLLELPAIQDFLANPDSKTGFVDIEPGETRRFFSDRSLCPLPERLINTICAPGLGTETEILRILTGSPATGVGQLRRLATDPVWVDLRLTVKAGYADTDAQVRDLVARLCAAEAAQPPGRKLAVRQSNERELFVVGGHWDSTAPGRLAQIAQSIADRHRSVLLTCGPEKAWDLSATPSKRISYLPLWNAAALRNHLTNEEMTNALGEQTQARILEVTGGCAPLIELACAALRQQGGSVPSTAELLMAVGVGDATRDLCAFFGIRPEHEKVVLQIAASEATRQDFERLLASLGLGEDAGRFFTYLEWMGAIVLNASGKWNLNPALNSRLVELA